MSKREWKLFIEDILESIALIEKYIRKMDFNKFSKDRKTIDAVVRNLEIIGEASKYIPGNIKQKYKEIDWAGVVGLRNRIAHEYFGISAEIVWNIITKELTILKEQLKKI
ncbi:hypothetical protein COY52_06150 [Candidatus Desantisbacteria bacterium CG_4_10_14_0_8_um_filter_48_22]|uniref:DUF86 domain-containing protein n=1 Tax=Candidatus Desantisbacteria bacterium CG_4_10_14_0_8_um_filter_48_22 TaxID=1974543 RepID=A0A2M7SBR3_9BACT|nr:MAG: hypothetical protein COY52_06150 [Candidatus Desantisbacteria bacterium CG_4_10_14_0_8_um_filter_48_22]